MRKQLAQYFRIKARLRTVVGGIDYGYSEYTQLENKNLKLLGGKGKFLGGDYSGSLLKMIIISHKYLFSLFFPKIDNSY